MKGACREPPSDSHWLTMKMNDLNPSKRHSSLLIESCVQAPSTLAERPTVSVEAEIS